MMTNKPYFILFIPPAMILFNQVSYLYQVPWWAGFRLAYLAFFVMLLPFALFYRVKIDDLTSQIFRFANQVSGSILGACLVTILVSALIRDTRPHKDPVEIDAGQDLYVIVLDSYTGSSVLKDRFGYDNTWFIDVLKDIGFQTGECRSTATNTGASLGAILNATESAPRQYWLNWLLVQRSLLRSTLEDRGYNTVAFATGYDWLNITDAAYYLSPDLPGLTRFEIRILDPLITRLAIPGIPLHSLLALDDENYRARTDYILDYLANDAADLPGSNFFLIHIAQPHPPFVYAADGSPVNDTDFINPSWDGDDAKAPKYSLASYATGYIAQVQHISRAILDPLRAILDGSMDPPLILLFGDHGAWYYDDQDQARSTLCAVYGDLPIDPGEAVREIIK